jgi:hypothetical protein
MSEPIMTREYARLSIRAGFIAARIERTLGDHSVTKLFREMGWGLTPDLLETVKQAAIRHGMPQTELDAAEAEVAEFSDEFMDYLMSIQNRVDQVLEERKKEQKQ